jgi:ankyrin repeat protein
VLTKLVDKEARTPGGETLIMSAISGGNEFVVNYLLANDFSMCQIDSLGLSELDYAQK